MSKKLALLLTLVAISLSALTAHADEPISLGLGTLTAIAISPDGTRLAAGTTTGVYFYNARTLAPEGYWDTGYWVSYLRWSPRNDVLVTVSTCNCADFRSLADGRVLWSTPGGRDEPLFFNPDGSRVTVATQWNSGTVYDPLTGAKLDDVQGDLGYQVDLFASASPDRRWSVTGCGDLELRDWLNPRTLVFLPEEHGSLVDFQLFHCTFAWSPDSRTLYAAQDNRVTAWDVLTHRKLRVLSGFSSYVEHVSWSPDSQQLITQEGEQLVVADLASRAPVAVASNPRGASVILTNPANDRLAVANDGVTLYDWPSLRPVRRIEIGYWIDALAFSPDGDYVAAGGYSPFVNIWNTTSGRPVADLLCSSTARAVSALAYGANGETLTILNDDGTLCHWDLAAHTRTTIHIPLPASSYLVIDAAGLAANRVVVADAIEGIQVRDATTGNLLYQLAAPELQAITLNRQGTRLAGISGHSIHIWDLTTGQQAIDIDITGQYAQSLLFSPDGQALASTSRSNTLQVWRVP